MAAYIFIIVLLFVSLSFQSSVSILRDTHDVTRYGADPSGETDSNYAFSKAWEEACASPVPASVVVPGGKFLLENIEFSGECNSSIEFQIHGTIIAPSSHDQDNSTMAHHEVGWIKFNHVQKLLVRGGVIDGQGSSFWECKRAENCSKIFYYSIGFYHCQDLVVNKLTSVNSKGVHMKVFDSEKVRIRSVALLAPEESPNTDGLFIALSNDVIISHSLMRTGDDCIAINEGATNIKIKNVMCGPGHGISIGSLANKVDEKGVQNITVQKLLLNGTDNGVRIKSWAKYSNGFVEGVKFEDVILENVRNPILIDQNYCLSHEGCPNGPSIKISNVEYKNIKGTSTTQQAIRFNCNQDYPCTGIKLEDIDIWYKNKTAESSCLYVEGANDPVLSGYCS